MTCGIYMIQNKANGKIYIGQAIDIKNRWKDHKTYLRGGYHVNKHLQNAWNKYDEENFEFSILLECEESQLNTYEQYYIFELMTYDCRVGYNKNYGGNSGRPTEEARRKISVAHTDKTLSEEHKRKISEAHKGKNNPFYGKHHTDEAKQKVSEVHKGKQHTEETKKKMSEARKDKPLSEEHRKKISEAKKGKARSEETKKKIGESHKGKHHTEETKRKISEANKSKNNPCNKPVVQIDPNTNEVVNIYFSIKEAVRQTGFNHGAISSCCNNKFNRLGNNIYKGFKWMFLEDYDKLNE